MKLTKGHKFVKAKAELMYLFCTHRLIMLYICNKFCQSSLKGIIVADPDSRVDPRVVANVDGRTDGRTDERMNGRTD